MAKYNQADNIHKKKSHKRKFHIGVWSVVGLVLVCSFYLFYDLKIDTGEVLEPPVSSYSTESSDDYTEINEEEFYIKIASEWEKNDGESNSQPGKLYSYINYPDGFTARKLDIYIGGYPALFDTNKIQKVIIDGERLIPLGISDQCFGEVKRSIDNPIYETIEWSWDGVTFPCNPSSITNIVTAGDDDIILSMTGKSSETREYTIVYTDHTNKIDNDIFTHALKTFFTK